MPNQYIIDYLKKHKDKFSFEILKEKLIKAGYPLEQIEEAKKIVYEGKEKIVISPPPISKAQKAISFWDFGREKTYVSGGEKILDFIAGFIFVILLGAIGYIGAMVGGIFFLVPYLGLYLVLIVYFLIKREYIALGMLCPFLLPFLLLVFYLLMLGF